MPRRKPSVFWAVKSQELNRWAKVQGVFFLQGFIAQLVIIDIKDPIGVMLAKPLRISKEEVIITGVFCLNNYYINQAKVNKNREKMEPHYVVAAYKPASKAFVHVLDAGLLPLVLGNPEIRYLGTAERERVRQNLGMMTGANA